MSCRLKFNASKSTVSENETGNVHEISCVWFFIWDTVLWKKKTVHTRWFRDMKHSLCSLTITKFLFCKGRKYSVDFSPSSHHLACGLCIMHLVHVFMSDETSNFTSILFYSHVFIGWISRQFFILFYLDLLIVIPLLSYCFFVYILNI